MNEKFELMMPSGDKVEIDTDKLFNIDETNLTREYAKQAALYAYYGKLYNDADRAFMRAEASKDALYAELDIAYREELKDEKTTEGKIKSMVITDEQYTKSVNNVIYCQYRRNTLRTILDALKMRADMMISMGAHLRAEYDQTGMTMKYESSIDNMKKALRKDVTKDIEGSKV